MKLGFLELDVTEKETISSGVKLYVAKAKILVPPKSPDTFVLISACKLKSPILFIQLPPMANSVSCNWLVMIEPPSVTTILLK